MRLTKLFKEFFQSEKSGGIILIFATLTSILIANSAWSENYLRIWNYNIGHHSVTEWINDALMTVFFLLIGLELEREIYRGELSNIRNASLPIVAAVGGMIMPAAIYMFINYGGPGQSGTGIPMATDIAFALGILSLLGNRVPASLKVFLTALAVIDDLGAIIVIAIFYTGSVSLLNLGIALGIFAIMLVMNRLKIHRIWPYIIGGVIMWYFMLNSGIHATITGVLLAFAIPFGDGGEKSPSYITQHIIHKPVAFFILPLFAIANTCIALKPDWYNGFTELSSLGILAGLIIGKPLGIFLFSLAGVALRICLFPSDFKLKHLLGAGLLGGIGFTMSIFISLIAFDDETLISNAKIAILGASIVAALIGFFWLKYHLKETVNPDELQTVEELH